MAWDDTPPTRQELGAAAQPAASAPAWDAAPPSPHELEALGAPEASPVTAATTGAIQGATLGWAPALGAAGGTAMDAVTGIRGPLGGGSIDDLIDDYKQKREELRKSFAKAAAVHPTIAGVAGIGAGAVPLAIAGPAAASTKGLAATGALMGAGGVDVNSAGDLADEAASAGLGAATTVAGGKAIEKVAPYVGKALAPVGEAISSGFNAAGDYLGEKAASLAEKATGATGKQTEKFVPGTGRELLDRGIVKFGSSPGDIAENARAAMDQAEASKADIVENQLKDTKVDRNTVISYLKKKMQELSSDESQTGVVKALQSKVDDIQAQIPSTSADVAAENAADVDLSSSVPLGKSEEIRRGFDQAAKWDSNSDAASREAAKITANAYREAGEQAATATDPELGAQFKADKTTQRKLIPVEEAAAKRQAQLDQSPHGGLLDIAAAGSGGTIGTMVGGPLGGVIGGATGLAIKSARPRIASVQAVSADKLAQVLEATPQVFGKFASTLQSAAARGASSLGATDYILQQTNPEYRKHRDSVFEPNRSIGSTEP